jgi:transposase
MDNQYLFLGIDVAKEDLVVAISETQTKSFRNTALGVSKLVSWAGDICHGHLPWFVMEASGAYSVRPATQLFSNHGARVSVVNPGRVKAHGRASGNRSKTDPRDAMLICDYAIKHHEKLYPWKPAPEAYRRLKHLVDQVSFCEKEIRRIENRMEAQEFLDAGREIKNSNRQLIRGFERQIAKLEKLMDELIADDEQLDAQIKLMVTIIGVGKKSARQILVYTRGLLTEVDGNGVTGFAGLGPAQRLSGTSVHGHSYIDKQGCGPLRGVLWMCSLSATDHNPALKKFYQRLITRENNPLTKKQARVAVMRKLLLIIRAVLVSGKPFDPQLNC